MKFEIKTEPLCAVIVAIPAYAAIVIITLATGVSAQDAWFPLSVIIAILWLALVTISFLTRHGK
jgi:hypothetical protein